MSDEERTIRCSHCGLLTVVPKEEAESFDVTAAGPAAGGAAPKEEPESADHDGSTETA